MLTSEMKSYIRSLGVQKNSINLQINDLGKTKETIEKLSTQITKNVTGLNNTIRNRDSFKSLAGEIKHQISNKLKEIQKMDKTSEITEALKQKAHGIREEAKRNLEEIQKKFKQHEQTFKEKIWQQVGKIKSVFGQLDDGGKGKIKTLEDKIDELVRWPKEGETYGSLQRLSYRMFKLKEKAIGYLSDELFLKEKLRRLETIEGQVKNRVKEIIEKIDENREYIKTTVGTLKDIGNTLRTDKETIRGVISGLESCSTPGIDGCEHKITEQIPKILNLNVLNDLENKYSSSLDNAKKAIRSVKGFKTSMNEWKDILEGRFVSLVDVIPDIKENELDEIEGLVKEIRSYAEKAYRDLENTRKMFKYLTLVKDKNREITKLSINGTGLEQIEATIENLQKASTAIKQAKARVEEARKQLEEGLQTDSTKGRTGQSNGEKKNMMPDKLDIKGDKFQQHKTKLEAMKEFNDTLTGIKGVMSGLNGNSQQSNGSDVDSALNYLNQIDGTLSYVYKSINSTTAAMKKTYQGNKEQINDTSSANGSSIKSHVVSIGQIPDKIAELQTKVKYYIVLLNIAKSVNETLKKVGEKAGKLNSIKSILSSIKKDIRLIEQKYCHICLNIRGLSDDFSGLSDLSRLKKRTGFLKIGLRILNKNIKQMEMFGNYLSRKITITKYYQKILLEIYGDVGNRTSQLIDLGLGTRSHAAVTAVLVLEGIRARIDTTDLVVGYLKGTISQTIMLMTSLCGVRDSIDYTKRKLEYFVKSLESLTKQTGENIQRVESSIESVIIYFLKCSNKLITENTIKLTKRMLTSGGQMYNNELAKSIKFVNYIIYILYIFQQIMML